MKILFLTKYDNLAASSRLRAFQFQNKLDSSKFDVDVQALLSNSYLLRKFSNKKASFIHLIYLFFKRIFFLFNIAKYQTIVIHIELFPYLPPIFEWIIFKTKKKIYFDYDDAIFHSYDLSENFYIKNFLSSKISYLMKMSEGVIAGNSYIENYAKNSGAKKTLILPTVIDIEHYGVEGKKLNNSKNFTIGWIGSPSTSKYLEIIKEPLARLGKKVPITLYLVGASNFHKLNIKNIKIIYVDWSEKNEQKALKEFDVGIMPLYDQPWDKGKCAFKLIQYMASYLPVVASNVGMNNELIVEQGTGFTAQNSNEWFDSLSKIYSNQNLRKTMGLNGRKLIERDYTIQRRIYDFENFIK